MDPIMGSGKALAAEAHPRKRARTRRGCLDWVMLDGVLCGRPGDDFASAVWTEGSTSRGEKIVVDFRVAPPPRISRLLCRLHLNPETPSSSSEVDIGVDSEGDWEGGSRILRARAVAAHRDCILLRFHIVDDPDPIGCFTKPEHREELFVFQASPLKLINLPSCVLTNPTTRSNVGIHCHDDGEFVVAKLAVTPKRCSGPRDCPVTAELCCLFGKDGSWRTTKCVPIHNAEGEDHLRWWVTDAVIPFGSYICWVDYLRGILFYDVSNLNPELKYVPLPVNPYEGNEHPDCDSRGPLSACRSLCVTEDGNAIKFVDVSSITSWFYGKPRHASDSAISSWKMARDLSVWIEDGRMEADHFFAVTKQLNLPCARPELPLVDRKDPQTIYFALKEESCMYGKTNLVAVEMLSKTITAMLPCTFGSLECFGGGMCSSTTSYNLFYKEPFIHCDFSKQLDLDVPEARDREDVEGLVEVPESSMLLPEIMDSPINTRGLHVAT